MLCRKCKHEIPEGAAYCCSCGCKQEVSARTKSRGNGQGYVFKRENGTWTAMMTVCYELDGDGRKHRRTRSKGGFKTKRDAVAYLPQLKIGPKAIKPMTFQEIYDKWLPTHRADKSTINNYKAAYKWFRPLWYLRFCDIGIDDLQDCIDECPRGRSTIEKMKALAGLLYKFAIPRRQADINLGEYLIVSGERGQKNGLPLWALEKLKDAIGAVPYADYVVAQCYLGFRPSELLALSIKDYDKDSRAFVGGSKTDAGRDRVVTVSPKIQPIIDRLTVGRSDGAVFGQNGAPMPIKAYREAFYAALDAIGLDNPTHLVNGVEYHTYTPHSCRHTFATLMKSVQGADKDKLELIGHTSTEMLRHYQDISIEDLRKITDAL